MSLGLVLISLGINPLTSYAQVTKPIPGTITSGDIKPVSSNPNQTWVLVNTINPVICYEEETGKQMILQLENNADYETEISDLKKDSAELEKQIGLLKDEIVLQKEQLDISKQTVDSYKELIKAQKDAFVKQIDNSKPSFLQKISTFLGGIGVGVLAGLFL